ncbi:MAG: ubiquinol-cytochrome C chaperone family protein [Pseudomonadota bacterium]
MLLRALITRMQSVTPLYNALVAQSRQPVFYSHLGVADTVWGRLDVLYLHVFMALQGLDPENPRDGRYIDGFFQHMFKRDIDNALREMGVGDLAVGHKIKKMAESYHGRATQYRDALLANDDAALQEALARNVLNANDDIASVAPQAAHLAAYMQACLAQISKTPREQILAGDIAWQTAVIEPPAAA